MWLFVVCDLYMNRVKVVGIVLKIYWYPLWLESHMSICASYTHTDTHTTALLCIVSLFFPLFFSSLILTRIWIIYIPQKCVGLFDFPFPAGYTHINLSACFIFVLFFVIVYIVFFCSTFSEAVSGEPPGIFMMVSIWMCKIYGILVWSHVCIQIDSPITLDEKIIIIPTKTTIKKDKSKQTNENTRTSTINDASNAESTQMQTNFDSETTTYSEWLIANKSFDSVWEGFSLDRGRF